MNVRKESGKWRLRKVTNAGIRNKRINGKALKLKELVFGNWKPAIKLKKRRKNSQKIEKK